MNKNSLACILASNKSSYTCHVSDICTGNGYKILAI